MIAISITLLLVATVPVVTVDLDHGRAGAAHLQFSGQEAELVRRTPTAEVRLRKSAGPVLDAYTLEVRYLGPVAVKHEVARLDLRSDDVQVIGRDGVLARSPPMLRVDRWSPKVVLAEHRDGQSLIVGSGDLEGMTVRRKPGSVEVALELDDVANHPFHYESRCRKSWRQRAPSLERSERLRAAGERETYRFWVGRVARSPALLLPRLFPDGYRAAIAFTDHADQSSLDTLRALLYGSSDPGSARFGHGGFLGHGLRLTKALFFNSAGAAKPQLEDSRVRALADALVKAGSEVVPHSATPHPDDRATTDRALAYFETLRTVTWIDHQVETNCEAFTDRGWKPGDPSYIADLLDHRGVRFVWSGRDPNPPGGELNMLAPDFPSVRALWLFGHGPDAPGAPRLWLWRSSWMYVDAVRFFATYLPARLDRLERERGLHIAHTYLESLHPKGSLRKRHMLERSPTGEITTTTPFEALLEDLAARQTRGTLLVAPIGTLAAHALAMSQVDVTYEKNGVASIRNRGTSEVKGATFTAPRSPVMIDGRAPSHLRREADGETFWLDLAPGQSVRVEGPGGFLRR